ncbi:acyl-CoA dehydrogenase family protein [Paraburkholderia sp. BL21I4N1]|uniref:acyl-CoA dehydrogenase family protein n=1 Tax=Paraburkholderia sp. BL21I4N1 TaxID=1938801 RepID=UPI000CFA8905|nr:acyl-CoA dehydrogenase family protein [Paraburkholderia sp. BL21I4N1]PQV49987.1 alkylation response protein AidB-like acyl-CoA dehydrogenase [Paraburkholderia sp. BL21I4N1]
MNLALSEEQIMIRDAAAEVLAERSGSAAVRHAIEHGAGRDEALWRTVAGELGWCALTVPEDAGGAGLGATELVLLMEQFGRRLACAPYFGTVCLAATALTMLSDGADDAKAAREHLARIASGELSATLALPISVGFGFDTQAYPMSPRFQLDARTAPLYAEETAGGYRLSGALEQVIDGASAELLLVPALVANEARTLALFELRGANIAGLTRTPLVTLDATRPLARLDLHEVELPRAAVLARGREAERVLSHTAWFAALALAAEQVGGAQQCLDLTLAYTADRVQFGRAIASFQAVKHRCAQMLVEIEASRSVVLGAAQAWDQASATASHGADVFADVAAAKASANDAFRFCAQEAIQLHGGVGFTWEYDPQLYFKRAQASSALFGTSSEMLSLIAQQLVDRRGLKSEAPAAAQIDHAQNVLAGVL